MMQFTGIYLDVHAIHEEVLSLIKSLDWNWSRDLKNVMKFSTLIESALVDHTTSYKLGISKTAIV